MANVDVTRIASNIGALNALNSLQNINKQLATHQTRLSTGKRINSAADDPAGLTIATKMLARSEGLKVAGSNIGDANNMLSVAEAGLSKMNDILVQMRSKAEQAASDTLGASERQAIQTQLSAFAEQIDSIVNETKWNGTKLIDGTVSGLRFQTGVEKDEYTTWSLSQAHDAESLGISKVGTGTATLQGNTGTIGADLTTFNANTWLKNAAGNVVDLVGTGAGSNSLSSLATGRYQINILDKATGATAATAADAKLTLKSSVSANGTLAISTTNPTNQLASGDGYKLTITSVSGAEDDQTVNWSIVDSNNNQVAGAAGSGSVHVLNGTAKDLANGLQLQKTDGQLFAQGDNFTFDFLKGGDIKYNLTDASGVAMSIDANGDTTSVGNSTVAFKALAAGARTFIDTGKGVSFNLGQFDQVDAADNYRFDWEAKGNNVINVSTASLAASYMDKVSTAINTVNDSMANLGSLMARLTFKEDQIATAQVNVESSYSRIMNANMAEEQVNASKFSILQQTATAMLAQANQAPQSLLSLFR